MRRMLALFALVGSTILFLIGDGRGSENDRYVDSKSTYSKAYSAEPRVEGARLDLDGLKDGSIAAARNAVTRSLPYIQREGVAWIELHGCTSCHQIPIMLWSQHAARERGFPVDAVELDRRTRWAIDRLEGPEATDNIDGIGATLLGRPAQGELRHRLEALAPLIAEGQEEDGSWKAQGQLPFQRRSEEETNQVSTIWSTLAIASAASAEATDLDATLNAAKERIFKWREMEGESFEWWVVRLLFEAALGDADLSEDLLEKVLALQNEDGGWPWILGEESDAFATGQALYALGRLDEPETKTAIERGRRFLVESQEEDGTWAVRSTLLREEGVIPAGRYWGTGWALVGLLETLPHEVVSEHPI